jgi:lipopolysaccharide export system permease protein
VIRLKILDRYILRQFLSTFFFVVLILVAVIVVIDVTEKTDKFVKANLTASKVLEYYGDFIPWIANLLSPITIFIATVYVCARMAGHTEVIAILGSGMSFKRLLVPYFIGAGLIAIISFILNGWVIPNSNKSMVAFEVQYLRSKYYYDKRNIHMQIAKNTYMYIQSYNNTSQTGYHFTLEKFDNNRLIEKLSAKRIEWDSVKLKWTLRDWNIKKIDAIFETPQVADKSDSTARMDSVENSALPKDSVQTDKDKAIPGGKTSGASLDTALVINPKEFESDYRKYDGMTMNELNRYIRTLKARGATGIETYEVEKYTRYASPFTIFILVFMGVIVSSRKSRGGTGLQIALGFTLSFLFILFFMLFRSFAEAGSMPPQISVWIPNLVFGIISLVMYKYVPR